MKVMDALFDKFDAFNVPKNFPKLVLNKETLFTNSELKCLPRHNILPKGKETADKVKSILYNYDKIENISNKELENEFDKYRDEEYRFVLSDKKC